LTAAAVVGLLATLAPAPARADAAARQGILQERFLTRFVLGVDTPQSWLLDVKQNNRAPFDVRAQYLSGGESLPGDPWWIRYGAADGYLTENAAVGCVTWHTYYMLAAAPPSYYSPNPQQATVANAKVASTMHSYFIYFKRLMQICNNHANTPVIAHVEPDEWRHLLLGYSMDPAQVQVKVGSCGLSDLAGLPDNWKRTRRLLPRQETPNAPPCRLMTASPASKWSPRS
jgi:hypothetical protein